MLSVAAPPRPMAGRAWSVRPIFFLVFENQDSHGGEGPEASSRRPLRMLMSLGGVQGSGSALSLSPSPTLFLREQESFCVLESLWAWIGRLAVDGRRLVEPRPAGRRQANAVIHWSKAVDSFSVIWYAKGRWWCARCFARYPLFQPLGLKTVLLI